ISIAVEPSNAITSPLRISENSSVYGIGLVDPADPTSSKIRIATPAGIKALRMYAPPVPPTILGSPQVVYSTPKGGCDIYDIPDSPARAFRDASGTIKLFAANT